MMAWRRSGDKPLSEPMMVSLPTHICVTRPQWVKVIMTLSMPLISSAFSMPIYACRRCSIYIFILDLTPSFNGLGKDNCKTRRETLRFGVGATYIRGLTVRIFSKRRVKTCKHNIKELVSQYFITKRAKSHVQHSRSFVPLSHRLEAQWVNSSPPGQNGRHFADDIFRCIFLIEKFCILIRISLKFVPKGPIDNKWALVQVMAWRRIDDKPLPEPIPTQFTDAYMRH